MKLEEKARAFGKTKEEAKRLSDEYRALKSLGVPRLLARADAALLRLDIDRQELEAQAKLKKVEEERLRTVEAFHRELGSPEVNKYIQAQQMLFQEVQAGRLVWADYHKEMKKARQLWTPEGRRRRS